VEVVNGTRKVGRDRGNRRCVCGHCWFGLCFLRDQPKHKDAAHYRTQTLVLDYESALDIMAYEADAACIYVRGINGLGNLNHVERYRFFVIWFHIFRSAEQLHYYSQEGMVEPRIWRGFERQLNEVSRLPGVREWWAVRSDWFSDGFQDYINGVIKNGDPVTPQLFEGDDCTKAGV
jgi:hypothetical protein